MNKEDLIHMLQDEVIFLQTTKVNLDEYSFSIKSDGTLIRTT